MINVAKINTHDKIETPIDVKALTENRASVWGDSETDLMWQVGIKGSLSKWDDIQKVADKLNSENYGGYNNWRVPTISELKTLASEEGSKTGGVLGRTYMMWILLGLEGEKLETLGYWSSEDMSDSSNALSYSFYNKTTYAISKNNEYYVRCVRGR